MIYKFEFFFSYMIFILYYIELLVFYTKLTNLTQKFKIFD